MSIHTATNALRSIALAALLPLAAPASAHEVPDASITHNAKDGIVRLYGAGGPDTAFKKVADLFHKETGIEVEFAGGPEPTWSKKAQANADVLWGTAEEDIAAMLETYKDFAWDDVTPIYVRPAIIAVKKGNPKGIRGFDDLLKDGMRVVVTEGAGVANTSGTVCGKTWRGARGASTTSSASARISSASARAAVRATRCSSTRMPMPGSRGRTGRSPIPTRPTWSSFRISTRSGGTSTSCWPRMPNGKRASSSTS